MLQEPALAGPRDDLLASHSDLASCLRMSSPTSVSAHRATYLARKRIDDEKHSFRRTDRAAASRKARQRTRRTILGFIVSSAGKSAD